MNLLTPPPRAPQRAPRNDVPPPGRKYLGTPIAISGAAITGAGGTVGAGTVALGASGIFIVGATLAGTGSLGSGDLTLTDTGINIVGDVPAEGSGTLLAGVLTLSSPGGVAGDQFASPIAISGLTGSQATTASSASYEAWETFPNAGPVTSGGGSVWLLYRPGYSGDLLLQLAAAGGTNVMVDLWSGTGLDDLQYRGEYLTTSVPTLAVPVVAAEPLWIRVMAFGTTSETLTWSLVPTGSPLTVVLQETSLPTTPGVVHALVSGAAPGETLTYSVEGTTTTSYSNVSGMGLGVTTTVLADEIGTAVLSVPVPGVTVGTYQVKVSGSSSGSTSVTFRVDGSAQLPPTGPGADSTPTPPVQTGVIKWVLQDPAGVLADYIFEINPANMGEPNAPRNFTWDHTASSSGPALGWETAVRAQEWHFSGTSKTQNQHDKMKAFADLNRRVWIFDHLQRKWLVAIEQLVFTAKTDTLSPWSQSYDCTVLVLKEG